MTNFRAGSPLKAEHRSSDGAWCKRWRAGRGGWGGGGEGCGGEGGGARGVGGGGGDKITDKITGGGNKITLYGEEGGGGEGERPT